MTLQWLQWHTSMTSMTCSVNHNQHSPLIIHVSNSQLPPLLPSPNIPQNSSTLGQASALVRMSAGWSLIGTNTGAMISLCITSWSQYQVRSYCFILPWCSGCLATEMALWLSTLSTEGPGAVNPISYRSIWSLCHKSLNYSDHTWRWQSMHSYYYVSN